MNARQLAELDKACAERAKLKDEVSPLAELAIREHDLNQEEAEW